MFETQLPSNARTSVWWIVWITTNCCFPTDIHTKAPASSINATPPTAVRVRAVSHISAVSRLLEFEGPFSINVKKFPGPRQGNSLPWASYDRTLRLTDACKWIFFLLIATSGTDSETLLWLQKVRLLISCTELFNEMADVILQLADWKDGYSYSNFNLRYSCTSSLFQHLQFNATNT